MLKKENGIIYILKNRYAGAGGVDGESIHTHKIWKL